MNAGPGWRLVTACAGRGGLSQHGVASESGGRGPGPGLRACDRRCKGGSALDSDSDSESELGVRAVRRPPRRPGPAPPAEPEADPPGPPAGRQLPILVTLQLPHPICFIFAIVKYYYFVLRYVSSCP
jgi:hypothetical protein